jgi:hypothetical protein
MGKVFSPRAISSATLAGFAEGAEADSSSSASSSKKPIKVTFSPSLVKTGYRTDVDPSPIKVTVTATVEPKSETKNITFAKEGVDRFSYTEVSRDESKGEIKLDVKGTSATPASKPGGDSTLVAKDKDGNKVGDVKVIVIIPKAVGTPHPQKINPSELAVSPVNQAASAATSPVYAGSLSSGNVFLWTYWAQWLAVPVFDEFNATLDPIYAGTPVYEGDFTGGPFISINQNMGADGTYQDPVFVWLPKSGTAEVPAGSGAATSWPTDPPAGSMPVEDFTQTIPVKVGGHLLSPGIFGRHVTTIAPNKVKIQWP